MNSAFVQKEDASLMLDMNLEPLILLLLTNRFIDLCGQCVGLRLQGREKVNPILC